MASNLRGWRFLLLLCLANFVAYLAVFEIPPIIGDLVRQLNISYAQAGLLMTVYAVIRTMGSLFAGVFSDRYGAKNFVIAGLVLVAAAGFLSAHTDSFYYLLFCRILIGVGATAIFIPGLGTAMFLLKPEQVNLATGIFFSSLYIGLSFAMLTTPILAASRGWQFPIQLFALLGLAVTVLFIFFTFRVPSQPQPSIDLKQVSSQTAGYSIRNLPLVWVSGAYFLLLFQSYGMITWLPDYLKSARGYSPGEVGSVSMLLGLILIPGSVIAGYLSDSMGAWAVAVMGAAMCALCPAALIFFPNMSLNSVFGDIFFLALGTSMLVVPLTTILTDLVPQADSGKAVGLVHTTGYAGSIASTYLGGFLLTRFGNYTWPFGLFAFSMVLAVGLLFLLRDTYADGRRMRVQFASGVASETRIK